MSTAFPARGVSAWTFHKQFQNNTLEHPEFFRIIADLGVRDVELIAAFLPSQEPEYLRGIRQAAEAHGLRFVNIAIDDRYDLSSADAANRRNAIDRTIAWLDAAVILGCPNVRNNSGGENMDACVESFTTLAAEAGKRGLNMLIEAHGGFSSDAAIILPIIDRVRQAHPGRLSLVADFGNVYTTPERDRYAQIRDMAPYASIIHPKMHNFDENGDQPEWNTARLVKIVLDSGFDGPWIVEYEGSNDDPVSGLNKSYALLERCFQLAKE
ncbi:MAG: sugar phosphate isomerase/epimerase [Capsulimonadaceae bacterium]|nr:sugar phosphate isomerase/epimerase [Capsulimonadaceae bacterium]